MTTEKPTDILPKLPTEMAAAMSTKNPPKPKEDSPQDEAKAEPNYVSNHREITITIQNHNYTTTAPRWQLTIEIYISRQRINDLSKRGR